MSLLIFSVWKGSAHIPYFLDFDTPVLSFDTLPVDSADLQYEFQDPLSAQPDSNNGSNLYLNDPSNVKTTIEYNTSTGTYDINQKIGDENYRNPTYMTFDEYVNYDIDKAVKDYWRQRSKAEDFSQQKALAPQLESEKSEMLDKILGGSKVEIRPSGSAEITLGVNYSKNENPAYTIRQQTQTSFNFDQKIQLSVIGKIGDRMELKANFNTESMMPTIDNKMNLKYEGDEDDIIKLVEAGNVSMPLNGALITGSQTLMGIKTQLQFGKLTVTSVLSRSEGEKKEKQLKGGAQTSEFEVSANEYEANKHYFLAQYFKDHYDAALSALPYINSMVNITKIEVWITNTTGATSNTRNIIGFMDLGESSYYNTGGIIGAGTYTGAYPSNDANNEYSIMTSTYEGIRDINQVTQILGTTAVTSKNFLAVQDYEKVTLSRKLSESEYTYNAQLGYISLNSTLNSDDVLAVAFQYTLGGQVYQVGEFSTDLSSEDAIIVKLLKSTVVNTILPTWELMMKNVYSLGSYQISQERFRLDILYTNDETGTDINYIPESGEPNLSSTPLLRVLGLDNLNINQEAKMDGLFDFIEGVTINSSNGRIYFPVIEPFGSYLNGKFNSSTTADKYVYQQLYDETQAAAQQFPDKNKFRIAGTYQSSYSNRISLDAMNVPQGSVTVTANGAALTENVDYTVDYTMGQVTIINQGLLNSGATIDVSYEANNLFNFTSKTFMGTHLDYKVSDNFNLGATMLNLRERPFTYKVNIGDEPINNTIWGINGDYYAESVMLTKILDKLPFYNTKTPSSISVKGEFAHLIPGHSKAIEVNGEEFAYIDDFEASQSGIDLKTVGSWKLASIPQGQSSLFPEASLNDDIASGFNRAKLAWYNIDPTLIEESTRPDYYDAVEKNHYQRLVNELEIFPNKQNPSSNITNLSVLDISFYPNERGPYNYDSDASRIDADGYFSDAEKCWAGITREIQTNDFEAANVQFIEFWVLDPFIDNPNSAGGQLYFNVGNISEDVIKDSRRSFENGLPGTSTVENVDTTSWGRVSNTIELVDVFDSEEESRQYQDVGLEGLGDADESAFFEDNFLSEIATTYGTSSNAYLNAADDPSSDNYHYFLGDDLDNDQATILERYKNYNGMEGNTNTSTMDNTLTGGKYVTQSTTMPNDEDINNDKNLSESESYFQYEVNLSPDGMVVGQNYIINAEPRTITFSDGTTDQVTWYQFRVPLQEPNAVVGSIQDFRSIRFLRMFLRGFSDTIILRFATLELIRGEWRTYNFDLRAPGEYIPNDDDPTTFDVANVNYEEHGSKDPVNYVLPCGINREQDYSLTQLVAQNEQALLMKVCDLEDGDARAAYKNTEFDFRSYKRMKMFLHAEAVSDEILNDDDVTAFIRLGSDFINNYYEYEIPLKVTAPGNYDTTQCEFVWPLENELNLELQKLYDAKNKRNELAQDPNSGVKVNIPYIVADGSNKISIMGHPNLTNVKTIMIGVRNPVGGDFLAKCAEVWINELRMTEFNESGGWAATMNVNTKLADLGTLNMAGNITTFGFGSIDKNVNERSRENIYQYDVSSSLDLKKFLPEKVPISIPMYIGQTEMVSNPQYNPLDPDILFSNSLDGLPAEEQDSLKRIAQSYRKMRSINFTGVKFNKVNKKVKEKKINPMAKAATKTPDPKAPQKPKTPISLPFDPSNFSFTYAYTEAYSRDISTDHDVITTHKGVVTYAWSPTRKNYTPGKTLLDSLTKKVNRKYAFKDKELKMELQKMKAENKTEETKKIEEQLEKLNRKKQFFTKAMKSGWWQPIKDINFYLVPGNISVQNDLDRYFNENLRRNTSSADLLIYSTYNKQFNWNRTYNLKYDLTSAFKVDFSATNAARIDEPDGRIDTREERDSVWENISNFGRNLTYHHTLGISYALPINKTPLTNWISSTAKYSANYDWIAAPPAITHLGNSIQNSNTKQINGQFNMVKFYQKVKYFDKVDKKFSAKKKPVSKSPKKGEEAKEGADNISDSTKTKKQKEDPGPNILDYTFRILMGLRSVSIDYSETNGTFLPGYNPTSQIIGQDLNENAPGLPCLFGSQADIRPLAIENEWITKDTTLNQLYYNTFTQNLNMKASIEPIPNLKIDVTASRTYSLNHQEYFRADANGNYQSFSPTESGNFTITFLPIGSSFQPYQKDGNQTFQNFISYTKDIALSLASLNPNYENTLDTVGYPVGYGLSSQEVLIPAFIAAYSGQNPNDPKFNTSPFPKIPMPNWSFTYDGLSNIQFLKKYFSKISLNHSYKSTYSVASFTSDLNFEELDGFSSTYNTTGNFISEYLIYDVQLTEQFSPLLGINLTMVNSMTAKVEYRKDRTLGMSLSNYQINERNYNEVVIGLGYKIKNVVIPYKIQGVKKKLKSDLDLKTSISVKDEKVVLRKYIENINEEYQGGKIFTINVSADYMVSKRLSVRLFFDRTATNPFVPSSYRTVTASSGVTFRFTLSQ
jgi:cell surface protein SprA